MKIGIVVNGVQVQFYLDTGAEVNKDTFDHIGAPSLQVCDQVACMYNGQTAMFLGKGRAVFKRRDHATEDVFYVAP
jgi:NADH:ubiquinone oxidoreductase subunit E